MTNTTEVRITWSGAKFGKAVANAKSAGGKFNAATKTWTINSNCAAVRYDDYASYGFAPVAKVAAPAAGACCPNCGTVCYGDCAHH